ncbi:hypothetical protein JCM10207_007290 [Rhodosporidiobolus poonsookiae]
MQVILPGDPLPPSSSSSSSSSSKTLHLGPGLVSSSTTSSAAKGKQRAQDTPQQQQQEVHATRAGLLGRVEDKDRERCWIEGTQKRYTPHPPAPVLGIITARHAEGYRVDIGAAQGASLDALAFEGATKRNKPNLKIGALLYCSLLPTPPFSEPELSCVDASTQKAAGFGELTGGMLVRGVELGRCRALLSPSNPLLARLGARYPFEIAVGLNGRVWVKATRGSGKDGEEGEAEEDVERTVELVREIEGRDLSTLLDRSRARHAHALDNYARNARERPHLVEGARKFRVFAAEEEGRTGRRLRRRGEAGGEEGRAREKRQDGGGGQTGVVQLQTFYQRPLDIMVHGPVAIGTPAQSFDLLWDTGSADLWVYGDGTGSDEPEYDASRSSTSAGTGDRVPWEIQYGKGQQEGYLAQDYVSIGGYTVNETVFAVATTLNTAFTPYPISGLFGLGFGTISSSGYAPWFERLVRNSGGEVQPYFGFEMIRSADVLTSSSPRLGSVDGGEVCLGCVDSSKYTGEITWSPVVSDAFWAIDLDGIALNGTDVEGTGARMVVDSGTTLIQLPPSAASALYARLPGASQRSDGSYTLPCSTRLSSFAFTFQGRRFEVPPEDLLRAATRDGRTCLLTIASGENRDADGELVGILGGVFLKNAYAVYSYSHNGAPAVGFATSLSAGTWGSAESTDDTEDLLGGVTGTGGGSLTSAVGETSSLSGAPLPSRTATGRTSSPFGSASAPAASASDQPSQASGSSYDDAPPLAAHVAAGVIAVLAVGGGWMLG